MVATLESVGGVSFELTPDQKQLQKMARDFATKEIIPVAEHYDRDAIFPKDIFEKARKIGLVNMNIPEAYGGVGASVFEECLVSEEMAYGCSGISTSIGTNDDRRAGLDVGLDAWFDPGFDPERPAGYAGAAGERPAYGPPGPVRRRCAGGPTDGHHGKVLSPAGYRGGPAGRLGVRPFRVRHLPCFVRVRDS